MPTLTTVDKLKLHLGIPLSDTSEDDALAQWLDELDHVVYGVTGRSSFSSAEATEYYDGSGRELLVLGRRPVTAIAGVWVDGAGYYGHGADAFPASAEWTIGEQFVPKSLAASEENGGLLVAIRGYWPEGTGNIKVTYTAGYAVIPADLELAVHQLAATIRKGAEKGGIVIGETIGKYAYQLLGNPQMAGGGAADVASAKSILARYTEVNF